MSEREKRPGLTTIRIMAALVIIAAAAFVLFLIYRKESQKDASYAVSHKTESKENEELAALLQEAGQIKQKEIETAVPSKEAEDSPERQEEMPVSHTDEPVKLSDIYSEAESTAIFKCFDKEAESYQWEYYDLAAKDWHQAEASDIRSYQDGLGREISGLEVKANPESHGLMVRCTIHFPVKEEEVQTASLYILKDRIKSIFADDFETDANRYMSPLELPLQVTYQDGSKEELKGLNDFYFLVSEEEKDYSTSISGDRIETTTLTTTECDYFFTHKDEPRETVLRYRTEETGSAPEGLDLTCTITGKDLAPPIISDVALSPFEISNVDKPVTLTVTILAEDITTPYPELEYAFMYDQDEPTEEDWIKKPSFDIYIERNGTYVAYARDQSGNISQMNKQIITVDNKAPVITSVSLEQEEGWCRSNAIKVKAQDTGEISYCFENKSAGISSDWITYSEYIIDTNGDWIILARDAVGNIAETGIAVSNIDREAPIIRGISVKQR